MGRTANSLVTNAQATKQIGNEQAPINQNLSDETSQYNQAGQDLQNLQQQAQTAASGVYQGQQDRLSYAQNLFNTLYQQEQDKQAEADKQAQMAEAIREANISAANSAKTSYNLPNAQPAAKTPTPSSVNPSAKTLSGGKSLTDATSALKALLGTKDASTIRNTLTAIQKSAQYGNTYDQAKLQLVNSRPEFKQYLANFNGAQF